MDSVQKKKTHKKEEAYRRRSRRRRRRRVKKKRETEKDEQWRRWVSWTQDAILLNGLSDRSKDVYVWAKCDGPKT